MTDDLDFDFDFDLDFRPSGGQLHTICGEIRLREDAIVSRGDGGQLLYGPYIALPPGEFNVSVYGESNSNAKEFAKIEITAERGTKVVWPLTNIEPDGPRLFSRTIQSGGLNAVEVRCEIAQGTTIKITRLVIRKISSDSRQSSLARSLLTPNALTRKPVRPLRIAVLGTCVAEWFATANSTSRHTIDHYLMGSHLTEATSTITNQYDLFVVHITLRHVISELRPSDREQDLFHTRMGPAEINSILELASPFLEKLSRRFFDFLPPGFPIFFLPFIEPPATIRGILGDNRTASLYTLVRSLNDKLAEILGKGTRGYYLETGDLRTYYGDHDAYDGYISHFTHSLLLDSINGNAFYQSVLARIESAISIIESKDPIKIIITDLDNTLWKGVIAEEDEIVPHEHTEGWPIGYVEALLECKRRGILLAISSKNNVDITVDNFRKLWGTRITLDDFCSVKINWEPKSESIGKILAETNLLAQNALFIDDNPLEIAEVLRIHPDIRTLSDDPRSWRMLLLYSPETQVARISDESSRRTELLKAKIQRDAHAQMTDRESYLRSLNLSIDISAITTSNHAKFSRSFELINKTNQFNTNGRRWTAAELEDFISRGGRIISVSAKDVYAEHGLIAVALISSAGINQIVMSCRVFGLGIETALVSRCVSLLRISGSALRATFLRTAKNSAAAGFFEKNGFELTDQSGDMQLIKAPSWPAWITEQEPVVDTMSAFKQAPV